MLTASLVRPWSSAPLPRSLYNIHMFHPTRAAARAYAVQPRYAVPSDQIKRRNATLEASEWNHSGNNSDAIYDALDGERRDKQSALLSSLERGTRSLKLHDIEKAIANLSTRIAIEKENHPSQHELKAHFHNYQAKLLAKEDLGRKTKRALWQRNKKFVAAANKDDVAAGRILEYEWKAEIHEYERTLNKFKYYRAMRVKDEARRAEAMDAWKVEEARLEREGKELAEEEKWVGEYLDGRSARNKEPKEGRQEGEVEKMYVPKYGVTRTTFGLGLVDGSAAAGFASKPSKEGMSGPMDDKIAELQARKNALLEALKKAKAKTTMGDASISAVQGYASSGQNKVPTSTAEHQAGAAKEVSKDAEGGIQQHSQEDKDIHSERGAAPEPADPATEERVQQLRDISESIVYLKDAAEDDVKKLKTIEKVEEMLRAMEEREKQEVQEYDPIADLARLEESSSQAGVNAEKLRESESAAENAAEAARAKRVERTLRGLDAIRLFEESVAPQPIRNSPLPEAPTTSQPDSGESISTEPIHKWPLPGAQPAAQHTLVDQLKAQLSVDGETKIDDDLTIDLDAEVPSLQSQIRKLSDKLKEKYPMMDTLPYDVWNSEKPKTLQTWLKILVWKWQTRDEGANEGTNDTSVPQTEGNSLDVRALLEQSVLEHGLHHKAAARMVKRWAQVFERKQLRKNGVELQDFREEELDMDELNAEMGWLMSDESEAIDRERVLARAHAHAQQLEDKFSEDSTFDWDGNGQGFGSSVSEATVGKRGYHTVVGRRAYSTSSRRLDRAGSTSFTDSELMRLVQNQAGSATPHIEDAENPAEDPFSNGEIADLLAAVAQGPTSQETVHSDPNAPAKNHASTATQDPPLSPPPPTSPPQTTTPIPHEQTSLPHLTPSGTAHMVSVSSKPYTLRTAIATGTVYFSNPTPLSLIHSAQNKKGDVLSVSRIAAIMAAKHTPTLIPLCHPIMITHVGVELHVFEEGFGGVVVESKVSCEGQTGVEMEALTSVVGGALSVVDMCKAVDKGIRIEGVRVVLKEGGRSGTWREEGWRSEGER